MKKIKINLAVPNSDDSLFWLQQKCAAPCTNTLRWLLAKKVYMFPDKKLTDVKNRLIEKQNLLFRNEENKDQSGSAQLQ